MAYKTVYKGIIFIEGSHETAVLERQVEASMNLGVNSQLKSLRSVKDSLCAQAEHYGCNAVVNFTYGQKSKFFSFDNVEYWGKGILAKIPEEEYKEICENCK